MNKQEFQQQTVIALAGARPLENLRDIFAQAKQIADTAEYQGLFDDDFQQRTPSPTQRTIKKMDWVMLRDQKEMLLGMRTAYENPSKTFGLLSGLIYLIDAIQDAAVEEGTPEFDVFGFGSES